MVARCGCRLHWIISVKKDLCEPYVCPRCEAKKKKSPISVKPINKIKASNKNEGRVSSVLQRNRNKFSISD